MIPALFETSDDGLLTFLRIVAGVIIFPYSIQKLLRWFDLFDGEAGKPAVKQTEKKTMPGFLILAIVFVQSFGSIALILGFAGRIAALGNFVVFSTALILQLPRSSMKDRRQKKTEGLEYFLMLLSLLVVIITEGSGALSLDYLVYGE